MDNNSCLTVHEGRIYIVINSLFASLGSLANLATIILILWTKAYKKHIHRLTLYLAVFGLCFSLAVGFEVVPVDANGSNNDTLKVREGWNDACTAIGFVAQHIGLSRSLAVLLVCFYVFLLAICQVKLKQRFYEAAGVTSVVVIPSLLSWVPFINHTYGLTGVWCWIGDDCAAPFHAAAFGSNLRIVAAVVGDVVPITTSVILIGVVIFVFCWRLRDRSGVRKQHLLALRELIPLLCYPLASAVSLFFGMINSAALHGQSRYAGELVTVCLMQSAALFLPLSFLLHPSIRLRVRLKFSNLSPAYLPHKDEKDGATSTQAPATDQTPDLEKVPLIAQQ